jgi:L-ascorbate metabolism protein UlaG (beta-lactamase superfamily)
LSEDKAYKPVVCFEAQFLKVYHRRPALGIKRINPIALGVLLCMLFNSCALKAPDFDEDAWRKKALSARVDLLYAPHYKEGRFFNPWLPMEEGRFLAFLRWRLGRRAVFSEEEQDYKPGFRADALERIREIEKEDFLVWIGHATFLMRLNGRYFLTDPMFSERAFFPKRLLPPALDLDALSNLEAPINVIISHNHYDHLDRSSLEGLPRDATFHIPLGLKAYVEGVVGKGRVTEMDWWQEIDMGGGIRLVCLPMQHWSRRIGQGLNESLWASFLLITPRIKVYFGGDTGYFIGFKEIGRRFPGIDYALIPTTAYHPRWLMHYNHMNMEEALWAFEDLGARTMVPQQWGTFKLGDEPAGLPGLELKRMIRDKGLDPTRFAILDIGEVLLLD